MFCPSCGKENPGKQRFCTACGLQLKQIEHVVQSLEGKQSAVSKPDSRPEGFSWGRLWQQPLLYGMVLTILGILVAGNAGSDRTLSDLGTLITILGVGVIVVKCVILMVREFRPAPRLPKPDATGTRELPLVADGGSVIEQTTRELEPDRYTRQL